MWGGGGGGGEEGVCDKLLRTNCYQDILLRFSIVINTFYYNLGISVYYTDDNNSSLHGGISVYYSDDDNSTWRNTRVLQ